MLKVYCYARCTTCQKALKWLKDHGTSVSSICLQASGRLEEDEKKIEAAGYAPLFKQEKGYEAYEYFDTSRDLGTLLEVKETY